MFVTFKNGLTGLILLNTGELGSDFMIIGQMHRYHIEDELIHNGRVNLEKLNPLARMAGNFSKIETLFDLPLTPPD